MITGLDDAAMRRLEREAVCGCGANLVRCWGGKWGLNQMVLRCVKIPGHTGMRGRSVNTRLLQGEEYDVTTQRALTPQETQLAKWETPHGPVEMSIQMVRTMICPHATYEECYVFLRLCQAQQLNPFLREVYLIKYDRSKPASIVVGKDTYTQRAERHPEFRGMAAGLLVLRRNEVVRTPGAFRLGTDELVGGWAKVTRRDRDPFEIEVLLQNYDRKQSLWLTHREDMIRKIALVQCLREAFPGSYVGISGGEISSVSGEAEFTIVEGDSREIPVPTDPEPPRRSESTESLEAQAKSAWPVIWPQAQALGLNLNDVRQALAPSSLRIGYNAFLDYLRAGGDANSDTIVERLTNYAKMTMAKPTQATPKAAPGPSSDQLFPDG